MDALTLLNQHIEVEQLLEHYDFDKVRTEGSITRACCKLHGGNNPSSFVWNEDNNLWYCHTGDCGGGDAYTLVQKMETLDFPSAVRRVADIFGVDIANLQIAERKATYLSEMKRWLKAMRKGKAKEVHEFHIEEVVRQVSQYRGFKEDTLAYFELGHVEKVQLRKRDETPYYLYNRLVFPIRFNGKQVGVSLRRVNNQDVPKWSHQPTHIETKDLLYNYDNVLGKPKVIVSEGITDVWAWHELGLHAVCTFGAHITDEQYRLLVKTGADLVFAFDGDKAGRIAMQKAWELFRYKANVEFVVFREGEDPESIPRESLLERYQTKTKEWK